MYRGLTVRNALRAAFIVLMAGCASTYANQFVGRTFEDVALSEGPPVAVVDLADGRRAIQYYWGGGTLVAGGNQSVYGQSTVVGNTVFTQAALTTQPVAVIENKGCLISLIGVWDSSRTQWVVNEARYPERAFC